MKDGTKIKATLIGKPNLSLHPALIHFLTGRSQTRHLGSYFDFKIADTKHFDPRGEEILTMAVGQQDGEGLITKRK